MTDHYSSIKRLLLIYIHNGLNTMFCRLTLFGSIFVLYLDALGLDKSSIGLMLALAPIGSVFSIATAPIIQKFGAKRVFIASFGLRNLFVLPMLLSPYIISQYGLTACLAMIAALMIPFSLLRASGENSIWTWFMEIVPSAIRGRFTAVMQITGYISFIISTQIANIVLFFQPGIPGFTWLIAVGCAIGIISVIPTMFVQGGKPEKKVISSKLVWSEGLNALKDVNFTRLTIIVSLIIFIFTVLTSFMPLFYKESAQYSSAAIVMLEIPLSLGGLLTAYLWGLSADRYGSKPIIQLSMAIVVIAVGLAILMATGWSRFYGLAILISFLLGAGSIGFYTGYDRYLNVFVIPMEKRQIYLGVFYAAMGFVMAVAPLTSGKALMMISSLKPIIAGRPLDIYIPVFAGSIIIMVVALLMTLRLQKEKQNQS